MALVGQAVYDVTDPVHPRLLCQVSNTVTHLYTGDTFEYIRRSGDTGTEVVLHSIGSGNESVAAGWPIKLLDTPFGNVNAWTPDGNEAATAKAAADAAGNPTIEIWLFAQPETHLIHVFDQPLTDCICRFGLPAPVLSFSADGQYLVSGWPIGKGAVPLFVYRVADHVLVQQLDPGDATVVWSRTGHTLYASGGSGSVAIWTPDVGVQYLADTPVWPYMAGLSPDGSKVAYTAYTDPTNQSNLGVYVFDIATQKTHLLSTQNRSEVTFVRNGWVWYREEIPCTDCAGQTGPTSRVFAMELATGVETEVTFAAGESPTALQSGWGPAEFWPSS